MFIPESMSELAGRDNSQFSCYLPACCGMVSPFRMASVDSDASPPEIERSPVPSAAPLCANVDERPEPQEAL